MHRQAEIPVYARARRTFLLVIASIVAIYYLQALQVEPIVVDPELALVIVVCIEKLRLQIVVSKSRWVNLVHCKGAVLCYRVFVH